MSAGDWQQRLRDNLARVRQTIAEACQRCGRDPGAVHLVAVTKYASPDVIAELLAAGVGDIGESHVQQLVARARACGAPALDWPAGPDAGAIARPRWHMIGQLQRNKVKMLLPYARIIHSLDSVRLAHALEQHAGRLDVPVDVFIEVNMAGEATKAGAAPQQVSGLVAALADCPHLRLRGLMTMAPYDPDPEAARPHFAALRLLLQQLRAAGQLPADGTDLSMGMSQDFGVAVEEGATFVRVGAALFEGL
jgi:pyridoxal phosphate enzyme (YggS family)